MRLNADFSKRVVIRPDDYHWVDSPMAGVERMMLDRIGDEVARATSLVRYAPNSTFAPHVHGGGEEFLVLEGVFSDEYRSCPPGTYVRNPIGTRHSPSIGGTGCLIFVKLHQFDESDSLQVVIETASGAWAPGDQPGVDVQRLHSFGTERVTLVRWAPETCIERPAQSFGEEIFVIEGVYSDEHGAYPAGTWIRSPDRRRHAAVTGKEGALMYVKVGHLPP